jgi:hypothetical protein
VSNEGGGCVPAFIRRAAVLSSTSLSVKNTTVNLLLENMMPRHRTVAVNESDPVVQSLIDYFRCPAEFAALGTIDDGLSPVSGYFAFNGLTCYGRPHGAVTADAVDQLPEVSRFVTCERGCVRLPFDLSEVVTNLRHERYARTVGTVERFTKSPIVQASYYLIRPVLPVGVRKHFQKVSLSGWEAIPFPAWPVDLTVDHLMAQVMALMLKSRRIERIPFVWFWPDGAPSCGIMTHDVEHAAGRDFCGRLMDLDDSRDVKASFQIVPRGRYRGSQELAKQVRRRGFEANVHDLNHDSHLFRDEQRFLRRVVRINAYGQWFQTRGFRSAAMYRRQEWFDRLEFGYDMSVPNVAHLEPQRGGCCTVMPYFIGNILELPLTTIQDYSLFHIVGDYSIDMWKTQVELLVANHGLVSFLTHPDYLIDQRAQTVYINLLDYLSALRAQGRIWLGLPGEVDKWWRNRSQMTLVGDRDRWRIEGPDSRRARVAYATLQSDAVVYEVERSEC